MPHIATFVPEMCCNKTPVNTGTNAVRVKRCLSLWLLLAGLTSEWGTIHYMAGHFVNLLLSLSAEGTICQMRKPRLKNTHFSDTLHLQGGLSGKNGFIPVKSSRRY